MRLLLTLFSIAVLGRSIDLDSWQDTRQQAVLCAAVCHALIKRSTYKVVLICKHL